MFTEIILVCFYKGRAIYYFNILGIYVECRSNCMSIYIPILRYKNINYPIPNKNQSNFAHVSPEMTKHDHKLRIPFLRRCVPAKDGERALLPISTWGGVLHTGF